MPVRRAESLTTLRVQCRALNSLADFRHASPRWHARLRAPERRSAHIRLSVRHYQRLAFQFLLRKRRPSSVLTDREARQSDEQSAGRHH